MNRSVKGTLPFALVEGPRWGDAEFYGKWLLAAAEAAALSEEAINDSCFEKQVDRLMLSGFPNFGNCATIFLSRLEKNRVSFIVDIYEEEGDGFAMMVAMGFFTLTGQRYQLVIPARVGMDTVKSAALTFAQTEDEECYLHPEHLIAEMPYSQAKEWQARLSSMDENHRCADRDLLLSGRAP